MLLDFVFLDWGYAFDECWRWDMPWIFKFSASLLGTVYSNSLCDNFFGLSITQRIAMGLWNGIHRCDRGYSIATTFGFAIYSFFRVSFETVAFYHDTSANPFRSSTAYGNQSTITSSLSLSSFCNEVLSRRHSLILSKVPKEHRTSSMPFYNSQAWHPSSALWAICAHAYLNWLLTNLQVLCCPSRRRKHNGLVIRKASHFRSCHRLSGASKFH